MRTSVVSGHSRVRPKHRQRERDFAGAKRQQVRSQIDDKRYPLISLGRSVRPQEPLRMAEARAGDFTRRLHLEQRQPTPRGFRDDVDFAPALIAPVVQAPPLGLVWQTLL